MRESFWMRDRRRVISDIHNVRSWIACSLGQKLSAKSPESARTRDQILSLNSGRHWRGGKGFQLYECRRGFSQPGGRTDTATRALID